MVPSPTAPSRKVSEPHGVSFTVVDPQPAVKMAGGVRVAPRGAQVHRGAEVNPAAQLILQMILDGCHCWAAPGKNLACGRRPAGCSPSSYIGSRGALHARRG